MGKITTYKKTFLAVVMFTLLLVIIIIYRHMNSIDSDAIVIKVDNEHITLEEFNYYLSHDIGYIKGYFYNKYNAEATKGFWEKEYNNENPKSMLINMTLEKLIKRKTIQGLFKEKELIKDISYKGYINYLKKFNKDREKAIEDNEPIYGPIQYEQRQFFEKLHEDLLEELKLKLFEEKPLSDEDIKKVYEKTKATIYVKEREYKIKVLSISHNLTKWNQVNKEEAVGIIKEILIKNAKNKKVEDTIAYYESIGQFEIQIETIDVDSRLEYQLSKRFPNLLDALKTQEINEVSQIMNSDKSLYVGKVISREEAKYIAIDQAKTHIISEYSKKLLDDLIDERSNNVKLWVDDSLIKKVIVD